MKNKLKRLSALFLSLLILVSVQFLTSTQVSAAPVTVSQVVKTSDSKGYLEVDGKPFLMGHVQNIGNMQVTEDINWADFSVDKAVVSSAGFNPGYPVTNIYDGNQLTSAVSIDNPTFPQYVTFTWDRPRDFNEISITSTYAMGQAPTNIDIQVSDDGLNNWTTVTNSNLTWTTNSQNNEIKLIKFDRVTNKKGLRFKILNANLAWNHYSISEVVIANTELPVPPADWMENVFEKTAALGFKTISLILKWSDIEPSVQGAFDWTLIDKYIDWCNKYDLRLDIAWMGSNFCGGSRIPGYSTDDFQSGLPEYLLDIDRFFMPSQLISFHPWIQNGGAHDSDAMFMDTCEQNAVRNLFDHLAVKDTNHRTILFQVYNEPDFHTTWNTDTANHIARMNNLAKAVKDSNYIVATRVNLAFDNTTIQQALSDQQYIDFTGHDPYSPQVSTIKNLVTNGASDLQYIAENDGCYSNTTSLALTAIVNGGFYDCWQLNDYWVEQGMYDSRASRYKDWTLGSIPSKRHSGTDMTNLNLAMNKIGSKIASTAKKDMVGFNIETNYPVTNYNYTKNLGGYGIGYECEDGSVAMALKDSNIIYCLSDSNGPSGKNIAAGRSATMSEQAYAEHPASAAVDDDLNTFAQASVTGPWDYTIDLGTVKSINRVYFTPNRSLFASDYSVKISTDGSSWTTIGTQTKGIGIETGFDFGPSDARYVKIDVNRGSSWGSQGPHAINEVKVYSVDEFTANSSFALYQAPKSVTKGYMDENGTWVSQGIVSVTKNSDGTYSVPYGKNDCIRIEMPQNIAEGKIVSMNASGYTEHPVSHSVDEDISTYTQSNSDVPWDLTVDLGTANKINSVTFLPDQNAYASEFSIKASIDNVNWTTVATETSGIGHIQTFNFSPVNARYVKVDVSQSVGGGAAWGHAIREISVFSPENMAIGGTSNMNTTEYTGHSAQYAIDGSINTYAQSNSDVPWDLTVDMGSIKSINTLFFVPDNSVFACQYEIKTSTDNVNWTSAATETIGTGNIKTYSFNPILARYVKIDVIQTQGGGASWGHAVREVEVYSY